MASVLFLSPFAGAETCQKAHEVKLSPHTVKYTKRVRQPGDNIRVGGKQYKIVRLPFVEFRSGRRYSITMPTPMEDNDPTSIRGWSGPTWSVTTSHRTGPNCSDVHVSGREDTENRLAISEIRTTSAINDEEGRHPEYEAYGIHRSIRQVSLPLSTQINHTYVEFSLLLTLMEIPWTETPPENWDLTDDIDFDDLRHSRSQPMINQLNTLVDFIYIEEM